LQKIKGPSSLVCQKVSLRNNQNDAEKEYKSGFSVIKKGEEKSPPFPQKII
jgi:hypothetical protein